MTSKRLSCERRGWTGIVADHSANMFPFYPFARDTWPYLFPKYRKPGVIADIGLSVFRENKYGQVSRARNINGNISPNDRRQCRSTPLASLAILKSWLLLARGDSERAAYMYYGIDAAELEMVHRKNLPSPMDKTLETLNYSRRSDFFRQRPWVAPRTRSRKSAALGLTAHKHWTW